MNLLISTINFNYSQNTPTGVTLHYRANKDDRSAENSGYVQVSTAEFFQANHANMENLVQLVREKVAEDIMEVPDSEDEVVDE
ncbi:hypothetical protein [Oceanobacillus oncorhynchi]|uniref:hypothetical protein n=1 Tax=Oceanobacillus oncorhynchi TaxID=545501 RepID=UPI0034D3C23C